jgi:hypothetical protein
LEHSKTVAYLLHKLQAVLAGGTLRATGFLALFYTAILFTEGIGVYMQQRWAEFLMVFATATLIPIEIRHLWHRPGLVGVLILLANCFIVWFLYSVLKRDRAKAHIAQPRELRLLGDFGETDAICVEVLKNPATEEGVLLKVMTRGSFEQGQQVWIVDRDGSKVGAAVENVLEQTIDSEVTLSTVLPA